MDWDWGLGLDWIGEFDFAGLGLGFAIGDFAFRFRDFVLALSCRIFILVARSFTTATHKTTKENEN
jgi:hypothetical protein